MRITRRLELDAGHRIPDHASQCRHLHGHRYAIEVTLSGEIIKADGLPVNGMVMDFADVKRIANEFVVERWDHAFLVYRGDTLVMTLLEAIPGTRPWCWTWYRSPRTWRPKPSAFWTRPTTTFTPINCDSNACGCTKRPTAGPMPRAPEEALNPERGRPRAAHSALDRQ